jgi:hypothetical protein
VPNSMRGCSNELVVQTIRLESIVSVNKKKNVLAFNKVQLFISS